MKIEGMIKSIKASNSVAMSDISQIVQFEVYGDSSWRELRGMMQKPLSIELTAKQMKFGEKSEGAVETTVVSRGRKKKEPKELVPA